MDFKTVVRSFIHKTASTQGLSTWIRFTDKPTLKNCLERKESENTAVSDVISAAIRAIANFSWSTEVMNLALNNWGKFHSGHAVQVRS